MDNCYQQTSLFSAANAVLLSVTVLDLRSNSQDTSVLGRYTVWVNLLSFLSLIMSLSCACWQSRFTNGRVDISIPLSLHHAFRRDMWECLRSLPTAWTRCKFCGFLKLKGSPTLSLFFPPGSSSESSLPDRSLFSLMSTRKSSCVWFG